METLRFLMISTHYPPHHLGGDAVLVRNLVEALEKKGHEAHVLYNPSVYRSLRRSIPTGPVGREKSDRIHMTSTDASRIDLAKTLIIGNSTHAKRELIDLARRLKPDVVHWHNTKGMIGRPFEVGCAETVYTAHDYFLVCPRSNLLRPNMSTCHIPEYCVLCSIRWLKPPQLWRLAGSRVIGLPENMITIAPSDFTARRLEEDGIRIGFRIRNFAPQPAEMDVAQVGKDFILYLGLLEPHKGVSTLLDAFHRSCSQHDFSLALIGEGSLRQRLKERSIQLGIDDRVHIPGFIRNDNLNSLRKATRIQIVPSEWPENAPLTAIEGLAFGTPLLVSDQGGLPEIAQHGNGCKVFPAGDVGTLSKILVDLVHDEKMLRRMAEEARSAYRDQYTPDRHLESYMKALSTSR